MITQTKRGAEDRQAGEGFPAVEDRQAPAELRRLPRQNGKRGGARGVSPGGDRRSGTAHAPASVMRTLYAPALAAAVGLGLYLCNRFFFIPHASGLLRRLLAGYAADFLAGGMMLLLLMTALRLAGRRLPGPALSLLFCLGCGLFWEYVTPLYLSRSVSDPRDVAAVVLGGACRLPLLRRIFAKK